MAEQTIVGLYRTLSTADDVCARLRAEGIAQADISIGAGDAMRQENQENTETSQHSSGFWDWLFGGSASDEDRERYARQLLNGSIAVGVHTRSDAERDRVVEVMEQFDPIDIQDSEGQSVALQTLAQPTDQVIPLAKEALEVGKRQVERRYRVRTHVIERPVEAQVPLRDERVVIEQRPAAGRASTTAPAFEEKDLEVIERHEEPVVRKSVQADEQIVVRKEKTDRVETVRESLRETKVDVEQSPPDTPGAAHSDRAAVTMTETADRPEPAEKS